MLNALKGPKRQARSLVREVKKLAGLDFDRMEFRDLLFRMLDDAQRQENTVEEYIYDLAYTFIVVCYDVALLATKELKRIDIILHRHLRKLLQTLDELPKEMHPGERQDLKNKLHEEAKRIEEVVEKMLKAEEREAAGGRILYAMEEGSALNEMAGTARKLRKEVRQTQKDLNKAEQSERKKVTEKTIRKIEKAADDFAKHVENELRDLQAEAVNTVIVLDHIIPDLQKTQRDFTALKDVDGEQLVSDFEEQIIKEKSDETLTMIRDALRKRVTELRQIAGEAYHAEQE